MKLNKLNDWIKVLGVYLVSGILSWILVQMILFIEAPFDAVVLVLSGIIMIAVLIVSGVILKDVKTWKVFTVFTVMYFVSELLPQPFMILFSAGYSIFLHFYTRFFESIKFLMPVFLAACMVAPLALTYIGMKLAKAKSIEVNGEADAKKKVRKIEFTDWVKIAAVYLITCFVVYVNSLVQRLTNVYGIIYISAFLLFVIYIFAGIYLKVKLYKMAIVFIGMPCIAYAFGGSFPAFSTFLSGGGILLGNIVLKINHPVAYIIGIMVVVYLPFVIMYTGSIVGRNFRA